jgi:hypothetical protein
MDHQDRIYFKGLARTSGQAVNNFKRFIFSTSKRLGKNKNGQIDENFDLSTQVNRIGQMSNHFFEDLKLLTALVA